MKLRAHPQWILRGLGGEELRVQPFDAPRPPLWVLLPPMFPIGYMQRWLVEPDARRVLVEIFETLFGPLRLTGWSYDEIALAIGPALETAFERKDLVVLTPRRKPALRIPPGKTPTIPPPSKPKEKTWIEIVLLDSDDKPVPNESYRITLPNGDKRTGKLDAKGFARIDGIEDAGLCDVEFPDIDGREWGRAHRR